MPQKPEYEPTDTHQAISYLVEECGEVLAAAGKTLRWGLWSYNPELPVEQREFNIDWLLREMADIDSALSRVRKFIREERRLYNACPDCKGSGFYLGPRLGDEPCHTCKGSGKSVSLENDKDYPHGFFNP
jgi:hypothetical protein